MDTTTLIWIIVGIAIVLVIVVVALLLTARGRRTRRQEHQHDRAERMRADARETELAAREHEAQAAQAKADAAAAAAAAEAAKARAAEAAIDADRRAGTIDEHRDEAAQLRQKQAETLRKADEVDPYAGEDAGATATTEDRDRTVDGHDVHDTPKTDGVGPRRSDTADTPAPRTAATIDDRRDDLPADDATDPATPPTRRERI
ncbi:hypothetical protein IF188_02995 [Microbacterium sp. NEAU-LLC]|uniref:Uncharacterized protein n=1 Tax=Microbacterium helvum TaxID=2773713 RepID=A0ABR8NKG3_9MICO|nr:hypothetical protein [Microbacterium helvum]MBD3940664.1 hypothetical protein [Microbacterium helvum]